VELPQGAPACVNVSMRARRGTPAEHSLVCAPRGCAVGARRQLVRSDRRGALERARSAPRRARAVTGRSPPTRARPARRRAGSPGTSLSARDRRSKAPSGATPPSVRGSAGTPPGARRRCRARRAQAWMPCPAPRKAHYLDRGAGPGQAPLVRRPECRAKGAVRREDDDGDRDGARRRRSWRAWSRRRRRSAPWDPC
jgi:hypothetical protein